MELKQETVDFQEEVDYEEIAMPLTGVKIESISNNEYNLFHYPIKIEDIKVEPNDYSERTSDLFNIKKESEDETELKIKYELLSGKVDFPTTKGEGDFSDQPPHCNEEPQVLVKLKECAVKEVDREKLKFPYPLKTACRKISKMPKTNAEKCKEYSKRNQAEKRKRTAERVQAHRLRQKIISEQSGTSINSPSNVISNSDACVVTPRPSHQPALRTLPIISKKPKTNAERCREYSKRNQAEKRKKTAERVRAHRLRQKIISEQSGTSINGSSNVISNSDECVVIPGPSHQPALRTLPIISKMPKTNAEKCKGNSMRNQAKSTAERVRAYRLRQKIISEQSRTSISGPSSVISISDECVVTPGPSRQPAPISLNEIISNNIVNQVGDKMYRFILVHSSTGLP